MCLKYFVSFLSAPFEQIVAVLNELLKKLQYHLNENTNRHNSLKLNIENKC